MEPKAGTGRYTVSRPKKNGAFSMRTATTSTSVIKWAMAKNGSSQYFLGQKRVYLKTIAAESGVGHIIYYDDWPKPTFSRFCPKATGCSRLQLLLCPASTRFWPFYVPFQWATRQLEQINMCHNGFSGQRGTIVL